MKIYKNCFFLFLIIASTHDSATAVAEKDDTRTAAIAARSRRKTRNEKDIGLDGLSIQQHERKNNDDSTSYYYDDELEIRRDLNTDQVFQFSCTGHACLVAYDMVQCVGYNYYGQLGQSSSATFGTPIQLNFPNTITAKPKKVVTGYDHTCTLFDDGYVWCNGSNGFQQLGIGVSGNSATPVQVKKGVDVLTNVIDIEAGAYHNCAIQNTGAMYCWGFDEQGQLGMNAIIDGMTDDKKATKMALSMISTCVITGTEANPNKFATCVGKGFTSENVVSTTIDLVNDVLKLTAGSDHFCALLVGDTAKCWGANNAGQLGIGSNDFIPRHDTAVNVLVSPGTSVLSGITDINAGYLSTCLVANGSPMCFGNNRSYQLGIANGGANVLYPTVVSSAQITDKTLISIHVGEQTGHAIYNDDSIYSMGTNYGGALGDGSIVSFRNVVGDVSGATISQMNFSSATIDQSSSPSNIPSLQPSSTPSLLPSSSPVTSPSSIPSLIPSDIPSIQDSSSPSSSVSVKPSINLSSGPSSYPSESPSMSSDKPSSSPSLLPSDMPSLQHSSSPSLLPSETPSLLHSSTPTSTPSALPSLSPSSNPSQDPYLLGDENSHITFNDIDFGSTNSVKGIKITYANGEVNSSGSVEVKLGDASGTTIAQFTPVGTNTWVDVSNIMLIPFDNTVQLSGVNSLTFTTSETTAAILLISYQLIDLSERYTPFTTIPATEVSTCSGVFASGDIIGAFDNGDYFTYSPIDFGSGANSIKITYAKGTTSGSFEIRKGDHETGEIIGTYSPASTGTSWGTFVTAEIPIQTSYGIDQLTFRGTSSNGGIMNLKSFQLSPVSAGYICLDTTTRTHADSVQAAAAAQTGANLVSIRCSAQQIAVHSLTGDLNVYIGGTDVDNEGVWVLPDGNAVTYSNWAPGHPDGSDVENCMVIKSDGLWNDVGCGRLRGSIFESTFAIDGLQCTPYVGCQDTVKIVENGIQTSDTRLRNNNLVTQSDTAGTYLSVPGRATATNADNWNVYNLPIGANDDFTVLAKLKVDGSGSAASFFINDLDNFGFDGSSYQIVNHLFTHSDSTFYSGFAELNKGTHHDNLFYFKVERKLGTIKFYINEEEVASTANYNVAISRFFWRPWRADFKIYDWTVSSPSLLNFGFSASGGDYTESNGYGIHTFTSSGTFMVNAGTRDVEFLIIAGGGSGGIATSGNNCGGGGGGAGGYISSVVGESSGGGCSPVETVTVTSGSYSIVVGAGGAAVVGSNQAGLNGGNSSAFGHTAIGGGGGSNRHDTAGKLGGSGGGGSCVGYYGSGETCQGYQGGGGQSTPSGGTYGGGGAGGFDSTAPNGVGGPGGAGVTSTITGIALGRAGGGGGGGGSNNTGGSATHGGGSGGNAPRGTGSSGAPNTGGGGGGAGGFSDSSTTSGAGGSGVVIIRYPIADPGYICLQTSLLSWQSSQDAAISNGANLVSIRCAEQNQRLSGLISSDRFWVGGSDSASEGDWVFLDGRGSVTYTNWGSGQPNNSYGNENCMDLNYPSTGFWNDSPCTGNRKAIYHSTTPITGMTCMSYVLCTE